MDFLSLLESSQSAVESSDQALRAAEAALSAAQAANKQAKEALKAVTEAFVLAHKKQQLPETEQHIGIKPSNMVCKSNEDSDDMQDFMMLSTNKNPVNDIEDDSSEAEDCCYSPPNFILISSRGPAAENHADKMGLYRLSDEMRDGRSVYIQEQDNEYDDSPCELFSVKGGWVVTWLGNLYMIATSPSKSPTSVNWQYFQWDDNTWQDDQRLIVAGHSEKPSGCEVTISLREDIASDIVEPGVAGVYTADGSYHRGRPVLRHSGGLYTLCVWDGVWEVSSGVGGEAYIWGGVASDLFPADTKKRDWEYDSLQGYIIKSNGISVSCNAKCQVLDYNYNGVYFRQIKNLN